MNKTDYDKYKSNQKSLATSELRKKKLNDPNEQDKKKLKEIANTASDNMTLYRNFEGKERIFL